MLAKGIEPSTVRLQGGCSTVELHQQLDEDFIAKVPVYPQELSEFLFSEVGFLAL